MEKSPEQIENHAAQSVALQGELKTLIAAYSAGGWNDGRLGLAYDLICEVISSTGENRPTRHPMPVAIDAFDRTITGE